jgi:hypothetical protein
MEQQIVAVMEIIEDVDAVNDPDFHVVCDKKWNSSKLESMRRLLQRPWMVMREDSGGDKKSSGVAAGGFFDVLASAANHTLNKMSNAVNRTSKDKLTYEEMKAVLKGFGIELSGLRLGSDFFIVPEDLRDFLDSKLAAELTGYLHMKDNKMKLVFSSWFETWTKLARMQQGRSLRFVPELGADFMASNMEDMMVKSEKMVVEILHLMMEKAVSGGHEHTGKSTSVEERFKDFWTVHDEQQSKFVHHMTEEKAEYVPEYEESGIEEFRSGEDEESKGQIHALSRDTKDKMREVAEAIQTHISGDKQKQTEDIESIKRLLTTFNLKMAQREFRETLDSAVQENGLWRRKGVVYFGSKRNDLHAMWSFMYHSQQNAPLGTGQYVATSRFGEIMKTALEYYVRLFRLYQSGELGVENSIHLYLCDFILVKLKDGRVGGWEESLVVSGLNADSIESMFPLCSSMNPAKKELYHFLLVKELHYGLTSTEMNQLTILTAQMHRFTCNFILCENCRNGSISADGHHYMEEQETAREWLANADVRFLQLDDHEDSSEILSKYNHHNGISRVRSMQSKFTPPAPAGLCICSACMLPIAAPGLQERSRGYGGKIF